MLTDRQRADAAEATRLLTKFCSKLSAGRGVRAETVARAVDDYVSAVEPGVPLALATAPEDVGIDGGMALPLLSGRKATTVVGFVRCSRTAARRRVTGKGLSARSWR